MSQKCVIRKTSSYIEDGISGENRLAEHVTDMVGRVPRQMNNLERQFAELYVLVIAKVRVEGVVQQLRVVEAIYRRECLLDLDDTRADTDRDIAPESRLEVLGSRKVVCMRMRLAGCV